MLTKYDRITILLSVVDDVPVKRNHSKFLEFYFPRGREILTQANSTIVPQKEQIGCNLMVIVLFGVLSAILTYARSFKIIPLNA